MYMLTVVKTSATKKEEWKKGWERGREGARKRGKEKNDFPI